MNISQVGAQLYTLRDFLKNPADIAESLEKVRQIGYEAVQVSGLGPIDDAELAKILDGQGLTCAATHEDSDLILDNPQAVADHLGRLNCQYTAYPYPRNIDFSTTENVLDLARKLDNAGSILRQAGMVLTYHNHSIEFRRLDGKIILDIIYDNTDPKNLQGEPDTYWIQHGGGCPVLWCNRLNNRLPLLHMKDYVINNSNEPTYAEIGQGNLDWPDIIAAAENAGCRWYLVEQDTCPGDPFDSLKISFDYIKEHLCT